MIPFIEMSRTDINKSESQLVAARDAGARGLGSNYFMSIGFPVGVTEPFWKEAVVMAATTLCMY